MVKQNMWLVLIIPILTSCINPPTLNTQVTIEAGMETTPSAIPANTLTILDNSAPTTKTSPQFYIVGRDIIDLEGNKFFPLGANVGLQSDVSGANGTRDLGFVGIGDGNAMRHQDAALSWGWNTVRLTIYCTDTVPWIADLGHDLLMGAIHTFIEDYTGAGIVVMVECQDAQGTENADANIGNQLERFWVEMAGLYKDNPYVWFEPGNEPVWSDNNAWLAFNRRYLDAIRGTGAENIVVVDAINAGNDSGWDGAHRLYEPDMGPTLVRDQCNVLFSLHAYGGMGGTAEYRDFVEQVHGRGLALVVGEVGYTTDGSSTAGDYESNLRGAEAMFEVGPQTGVGLLWWHGTHNDHYSLKDDDSPFWTTSPMSPAGKLLLALGSNKPNLGLFTGYLADSHCESAR